MRHVAALVAPALAGLVLSTPVLGQNLSERINHVMQQRNQSSYASKAHALGTLLYVDLTIEFDQTPARDAFNYLQNALGVNIIGRYEDDRVGFGIDPDAEITLTADNQPALTVLEMVLDQCGGAGFGEECTWQLREGFIEVGTKDRLNRAREIRYYPIRDLLFEPPYFNNAPSLNLDAALNQGGGAGGGGGGGGGFGGGGGGGGGFGGGGGGGGGFGGGGGGGSLFDEPDEEDPRIRETELAQQIIDLIVESVESDAWTDSGGDAASIRYYQSTLIVRAPDYIHRQIGGYPFAIRPARRAATASQPRYVTFTGQVSNVTNTGFRETDAREFSGAAGNGNSP